MSKQREGEMLRTVDAAEVEALVPLPRLAFQILLALAKGEGHGYAIAKEVERHTDGRTKPSTGSLYLSMEKLHAQELIEEVQGQPVDEGHDARRRYFRITPLGRAVARAETERMVRLVNLARERDLIGDAVSFVTRREAEAKG
jgi:DNA-binding PadR family transcriptional regulator